MKQRDRQEREAAASKVDVLTEALPWINRMRGKTFVIKYGGSAMEDEDLCRQVVADIELLKLMGIRIVVVHGGGKAINAQLKALMDEKQAVQEQIQAMEQEAAQSENRMSRMAELREWMAKLEVNTEYNDQQVRMAVERITVVDAETIHIKFRYPGLEMDKKLN